VNNCSIILKYYIFGINSLVIELTKVIRRALEEEVRKAVEEEIRRILGRIGRILEAAKLETTTSSSGMM